MGAIMLQSHASYSLCGLGSERTDAIVSRAKSLKNSGIAGAKITGGGSGGTVCLLANGEKGQIAVRELHKQLCDEYQENLALFEG